MRSTGFNVFIINGLQEQAKEVQVVSLFQKQVRSFNARELEPVAQVLALNAGGPETHG